MSGAHSVLAPSSLARTVQCPASVRLEQQFPETEQGPEAADGEATHWGAAEMLGGRMVDESERAPNGVLLTQEMAEAIDLYYDDVVSALAPFQMTPVMGAIESPVTIARIHSECWGTPDYRVWVPGNLRGGRPLLMLWDFKFGHRDVPVFENYQLVGYVAGCLEATNLPDTDVDVEVRIVQPRSYHRDGPVRRWAFKGSDIRALVNIASNAAHAALGADPKAHVGPECRDCRARHACPALQAAAASACDEAGKAQPFALPPAALGVELRYLKRAEELLKARITGLEEQVVGLQRSGVNVPHWRIEQGSGRRKWAKPTAEILALGSMFQIDLGKPPEPITPVQAVAKGLPEALLSTFTVQPRGAASLVPDDGSTARRIFGAQG